MKNVTVSTGCIAPRANNELEVMHRTTLGRNFPEWKDVRDVINANWPTRLKFHLDESDVFGGIAMDQSWYKPILDQAPAIYKKKMQTLLQVALCNLHSALQTVSMTELQRITNPAEALKYINNHINYFLDEDELIRIRDYSFGYQYIDGLEINQVIEQ